MEVEGVFGQGVLVELIVDVEVLDTTVSTRSDSVADLTDLNVRVFTLVLDDNPGSLVERHSEIAIGTAVASKLVQLRWLDGDCEWQRLEVSGHGVAYTLGQSQVA